MIIICSISIMFLSPYFMLLVIREFNPFYPSKEKREREGRNLPVIFPRQTGFLVSLLSALLVLLLTLCQPNTPNIYHEQMLFLCCKPYKVSPCLAPHGSGELATDKKGNEFFVIFECRRLLILLMKELFFCEIFC